MHRSVWIAVLAGASGCQILNPAFGLFPDTDGDTAGSSASDAQTEPVLTTSSEPTTTAPTGTTVDPATGDSTVSSEPPLTSTGVDTHDPATDTDVDPTVPAGCGNGVPDQGEECDDGDDIDGDDCTNSCKLPICGDGIIQAGKEECDAGGQPDDGCTEACLFNTCGDGHALGDEACDDGNVKGFDGCTPDCKANCSDGLFDSGVEECDPSVLPFGNYPGLCSQACELNTCFRMTNTEDEDIEGPDWFDGCANAPGERIAVLLRDDMGVQYFQAGKKPLSMVPWNSNQMTSVKSPPEQWKFSAHDRKVVLADLLVDKPEPVLEVLYAFGKSSAPKASEAATCPSSLGDGYALAIMSSQDPTKARVLLMPFSGVSIDRNIAGWLAAGPGIELAFDGGEPMALCAADDPPAPFLGTIAIAVF